MRKIIIFCVALIFLTVLFSGMVLADGERAVTAAQEEESVPIPLVVVLVVLGAVHLAFPQFIWKLVYGWQYKNARPTAQAIVVYRVVGAALIGAGLFMLAA